ncbi:MAG: N-acyl-D-amino-acid deacylase family protein [Gemmatimonadales bacterium]
MRPRLGALAVAALAACRPGSGTPTVEPSADTRYDVIISGARVVDGTGNAWFLGDVGVRGDRIARVAPAGSLARAATPTRVDARGLVVAPGFIDIQGQSYDHLLLGDGRALNKVTQGVTTEILGEGYTPAPSNDRVESLLGFFVSDADSAAGRTAVAGFRGPHGFGAWLEAMERHGISVNVGSFLGASTVRVYAKGMAEGAASPAELDTMRAAVSRAMEDGAFGLGTALIYPPGNFASTAELIELARAMAPHHGVYITHMRSEADDFLEGIDEAFAIGRDAGVPVEIYHLKAAGKRNWRKAALAIAKIDSARAAGQDVGADMYPYEAGGTALAACFPPWASADDELLENLKDSSTRARIRADVAADRSGEWENLCQLATPEGVRIGGFEVPEHKAWEGKSLAEIAASRRQDWVDALIDLTVKEEGRLGALYFLASEENLALQIRQPWIKFGTDAGAIETDSIPEGETHPRTHGTYTRILGRYVREQRLLPLEDGVRKMTSAVAARLSLRDRGLVREGMYADLVVFDPATVGDRATYDRSHQLSAGIRHVFVNGIAVLRGGAHTGAKPGRAVRGPGWIQDR